MTSKTRLSAKKILSIEAAMVTVRAISIDNKKMTLSVFRQLEERFPAAGGPCRIWGRVKYAVDASHSDENFLWSDGAELFRCGMASLRWVYIDPGDAPTAIAVWHAFFPSRASFTNDRTFLPRDIIEIAIEGCVVRISIAYKWIGEYGSRMEVSAAMDSARQIVHDAIAEAKRRERLLREVEASSHLFIAV